MRYNPKNRKEADFSVPPPGKYRVQITEARPEASKSTGADMIVLECTILPGQAGAGSKLWDYLVDGEWFATKAGQVLESVGIRADAETDVTPELLYQRVGVVQTKVENFNGRERAKIAYWCKSNGHPQEAAPVAASPRPRPDQVTSEDGIPY